MSAKLKMAVVCLLLTYGGLTTLYAQGGSLARPTRTVQNQLLLMTLAMDDYQVTHDAKFHNLDEGEYGYYYVTLHRGWDYIVRAACDGDCNDIDLYLYDENGYEIGKDNESDDIPAVRVRPRWTGRFKVKVKMYDCDVEPCVSGIAVFGQ